MKPAGQDMDFTGDAEVLAAFRGEAEERLAEIEAGLAGLSDASTPPDLELWHRLFRCAHSIKASANLLELQALEKLAHNLEDYLDLLRKGVLDFDGSVMETMLEYLDAMGFYVEGLTIPPTG